MTWVGQGYTHVAHRWIELDWRAPPAYVDFTVQWSDPHTGGWIGFSRAEAANHPDFVADETQPNHPSVRVNGPASSAVIRGLPNVDIKIRVVGKTTAGAPTRWPILQVSAPDFPTGGHQHDHTVSYDLSLLGNTVLGNAVRGAAEEAAKAWKAQSFIKVCKGQCSANSDMHLNRIKVVGSEACGSYPRRRLGCAPGGYVSDVDYALGVLGISISNPPYQGTRQYRWTRDPLKTGLTGLNEFNDQERWQQLDPVLLHEFGHLFGFWDMGGSHIGIMRDIGFTSIQPADTALVYRVYKGHVSGSGW